MPSCSPATFYKLISNEEIAQTVIRLRHRERRQFHVLLQHYIMASNFWIQNTLKSHLRRSSTIEQTTVGKGSKTAASIVRALINVTVSHSRRMFQN